MSAGQLTVGKRALPAATGTDPFSIVVPPRLRPVDEDWVAALAESIDANGQIEAVTVRRHAGKLVLVAGAHRLAACVKLNREIEIRIVDMTPAEARLAEIDENLFRHELAAIDWCIFVAERQSAWQQLYPETKRGGDRRSKTAKIKSKLLRNDRFTKATAEKLGMSERTVQQGIAIAKAFSGKEIDGIRNSLLADHKAGLRALAKLPPSKRSLALREILAGGAKTVAQALGGATKTDPLAALLSAWSRSNRRTRLRFIDQFRKELTELMGARGG